MMWYWGGGMHWWGWLIGSVLVVAFWVLVVWAFWYMITGFARRGEPPGPPAAPPGPAGPPPARRILDERLARGEITPEEYRHLLDVMAGPGPGPGPDRDAGGRAPSGTAGRS